jgi:hypothetical protein
MKAIGTVLILPFGLDIDLDWISLCTAGGHQ